jgi:hypothetical protein
MLGSFFNRFISLFGDRFLGVCNNLLDISKLGEFGNFLGVLGGGMDGFSNGLEGSLLSFHGSSMLNRLDYFDNSGMCGGFLHYVSDNLVDLGLLFGSLGSRSSLLDNLLSLGGSLKCLLSLFKLVELGRSLSKLLLKGSHGLRQLGRFDLGGNGLGSRSCNLGFGRSNSGFSRLDLGCNFLGLISRNLGGNVNHSLGSDGNLRGDGLGGINNRGIKSAVINKEGVHETSGSVGNGDDSDGLGLLGFISLD